MSEISERDKLMFCNKCGEKILEDAVFCNKCGARTEVVAQTIQVQPTPSVDAYETPNDVEYVQMPVLSQPAGPSTPVQPVIPAQPTTFLGKSLMTGAAKIDGAVSSKEFKENAGLFTALGGGVLALFAFCFLPYMTLSIFGASLSFLGSQLASFGTLNTYLPGLGNLWFLWLEPLAAAVVIGISGYIVMKRREVGIPKQAEKRLMLVTAWTSGIVVAILFIRWMMDLQPIVSAEVSVSIASFYGIGMWIYGLSMIAILIGSFVQYKKK